MKEWTDGSKVSPNVIFSKHQRKSSETIEKFGYESYNLKISYGY